MITKLLMLLKTTLSKWLKNFTLKNKTESTKVNLLVNLGDGVRRYEFNRGYTMCMLYMLKHIDQNPQMKANDVLDWYMPQLQMLTTNLETERKLLIKECDGMC